MKCFLAVLLFVLPVLPALADASSSQPAPLESAVVEMQKEVRLFRNSMRNPEAPLIAKLARKIIEEGVFSKRQPFYDSAVSEGANIRFKILPERRTDAGNARRELGALLIGRVGKNGKFTPESLETWCRQTADEHGPSASVRLDIYYATLGGRIYREIHQETVFGESDNVLVPDSGGNQGLRNEFNALWSNALKIFGASSAGDLIKKAEKTKGERLKSKWEIGNDDKGEAGSVGITLYSTYGRNLGGWGFSVEKPVLIKMDWTKETIETRTTGPQSDQSDHRQIRISYEVRPDGRLREVDSRRTYRVHMTRRSAPADLREKAEFEAVVSALAR